MRRFKNILFVADGGGSEKLALIRTMDLAKSNRAKLTVFDVVKEFSFNFADPETIKKVENYQNMLIRERREELEKLVNTVAAKHPGVVTNIEVRTGKTFIEIIRAMLHKKYDLIIKVRKGSMGPVQMLFGSTDLKLMRKCPCPVWIIKPSKRKRYTRILAAVDLDPSSPESLNRLIMDLATSLAETGKSELHVVHAWQLENESILRGGHIPKRELNELKNEMQLAHQHQLDALLSHYRTHKKTVRLITGSAGEVIPTLASEKGIDLIVMGTVGRTGIPGLIIGNTAEKILNTVDCSVLTVKPEGFKFPA